MTRPLCQEEMPFFLFTHTSFPFPVMDLCEYSANLIVFFFLIKFNKKCFYLFIRSLHMFNFFINNIVRELTTSREDYHR